MQCICYLYHWVLSNIFCDGVVMENKHTFILEREKSQNSKEKIIISANGYLLSDVLDSFTTYLLACGFSEETIQEYINIE